MLRRLCLPILCLAAAAIAGPALADPCKAIPDKGPPPAWIRAGVSLAGPVRHVGDGDSLCIGRGPTPIDWVEIRLADFYAPELAESGGRAARETLVRLTQGRTVTCVATPGGGGRVVSYDRMIAVCRIDGVSLGALMRRAGVREGGRGR
ncbi:MAG: nuclease [Pseudomonadota bacterium]